MNRMFDLVRKSTNNTFVLCHDVSIINKNGPEFQRTLVV